MHVVDLTAETVPQFIAQNTVCQSEQSLARVLDIDPLAAHTLVKDTVRSILFSNQAKVLHRVAAQETFVEVVGMTAVIAQAGYLYLPLEIFGRKALYRMYLQALI